MVFGMNPLIGHAALPPCGALRPLATIITARPGGCLRNVNVLVCECEHALPQLMVVVLQQRLKGLDVWAGVGGAGARSRHKMGRNHCQAPLTSSVRHVVYQPVVPRGALGKTGHLRSSWPKEEGGTERAVKRPISADGLQSDNLHATRLRPISIEPVFHRHAESDDRPWRCHWQVDRPVRTLVRKTFTPRLLLLRKVLACHATSP